MSRLLAVLIIFMSVACHNETSTTSSPVRLSTSSSTAQMDLQIVVPPGPGGEYPPDLLVTCPYGQSFPVGALKEIVPVAWSDSGLSAAMAQIVSSSEAQHWPEEYKDGWLVLHQDADSALLVNPVEGLGFVNFEKVGDTWSWIGAQFAGGPCPLMFGVPDGLNAVQWRLDPAAQTPGRDDTTVAVLIQERECVSGIEIGDRLIGPQVVTTDTKMFIEFAATPPDAALVNCQGNPETPYLVHLSEPLGDRELMEGTGLNLEDYLD